MEENTVQIRKIMGAFYSKMPMIPIQKVGGYFLAIQYE